MYREPAAESNRIRAFGEKSAEKRKAITGKMQKRPCRGDGKNGSGDCRHAGVEHQSLFHTLACRRNTGNRVGVGVAQPEIGIFGCALVAEFIDGRDGIEDVGRDKPGMSSARSATCSSRSTVRHCQRDRVDEGEPRRGNFYDGVKAEAGHNGGDHGDSNHQHLVFQVAVSKKSATVCD